MVRILETGDAGVGEGTQYLLKNAGTIEGSISVAGDVDWYKHVLNKPRGWSYIFYAEKDGALDGLENRSLTLYDRTTTEIMPDPSTGITRSVVWLTEPTAAKRTVVYTSIEDGTYLGDQTGDYHIRVVKEVAANKYTKAQLKLGTAYDGVFEEIGTGVGQGDRDWIKVRVKAGEAYYFTLDHDGPFSTLRNEFNVVDRDGNVISKGGEAYAHLVAQQTGWAYLNAVYRIMDGNDQGYSINGYRDVPEGTSSTETLTFGRIIGGYGMPIPGVKDYDSYATHLEKGLSYKVTLANDVIRSSSTGEIRILDEYGKDVIPSKYDKGEFSYVFTPGETGRFYITVWAADDDFDDPKSKDPDYKLTIGRVGDLYGTSGKDKLVGTAGADTLIGFEGRDVLVGRKGADTFVFNAHNRRDVVKDYKDGVDMLEVEGMGRRTAFEAKQKGDDTIVTVKHISFVLSDTDATDIDKSDFVF